LVLSEWKILTTGGENDNEASFWVKGGGREILTDSIENSSIRKFYY
jgi:hypothetical protein